MDPKEKISEGIRLIQAPGKWGKEHGIPTPLLQQAYGFEKDPVAEPLMEKVEKGLKFHEAGTKVFFLTGTESPTKDLLSVLLLLGMLGQNHKLMHFFLATSFEPPGLGNVALMACDRVKGLQALKVQNFIKAHVLAGKSLLVGGESLEKIEEGLGAPLMDYLSHSAVEIENPLSRQRIPKM
jgi:hypothetical protein